MYGIVTIHLMTNNPKNPVSFPLQVQYDPDLTPSDPGDWSPGPKDLIIVFI